MLLGLSDYLELWPPASLLLLPWWRLGHLPVTAEHLNSFSMCSRGSPVCAASGHNSAARARGARLQEHGCFSPFQAIGRGILALDFRFHPMCSWALLTESLSDLHCRFCPSHLPQAGGHELCDFSGYPERRPLAKSCPRASRSWPLWPGVHRALATGSCLPIFSVSETPAQAVSGVLRSVCTSPQKLIVAYLPNCAFTPITWVPWNRPGWVLSLSHSSFSKSIFLVVCVQPQNCVMC